jgi:hypothetical protein
MPDAKNIVNIDLEVPEPDWFEEGMKAKIQEIAERDPTPRNLLELERTAHLFKALLAVWKNPLAAGHGKMLSYGQFSLNQGDYGSSDMEVVDTEDGGIMLQNTHPRAETFGATVVRELVASMKEIAASLGPKEHKPGPVELVHAIALARDEHMDDLADALQVELLKSQEASAEDKHDHKLLSRSGAWPPASASDALLPSDPATPADMHALQAMVDDISTAPRIVVHDATTAEAPTDAAPVAPVVVAFHPGGVRPATPAEAVALFDAMRKKQREGKMLTRDEERAAVGGAIVTHSDPMLTPPTLVRKTPFDPNGGSGVGEYQSLHPGGDDFAAQVMAFMEQLKDKFRAGGPVTPEEQKVLRHLDFCAREATTRDECVAGRIAAHATGPTEYVKVTAPDGRDVVVPKPVADLAAESDSKATLDRVLTVYRAVLLIVRDAFAEACHARHDRDAVDEQLDVMRRELASLPDGWDSPNAPIGGALRDALCDVKTALSSIAFSPPEGMPLHLGRIREALHLLPKGWDTEASGSVMPADQTHIVLTEAAMHAAGIEPPDARPATPVAGSLPTPDKPVKNMEPWSDGVPGYDAEGRLLDPSYKGT